MNSSTGIVSVYIVCANAEEAARIAHQLVDERLAACVNMLGHVESVYRWQGRIETATEVAMIAKTSASMADVLIHRAVELHSYDNPAIVAWPIESAPDPYVHWVKAQMR